MQIRLCCIHMSHRTWIFSWIPIQILILHSSHEYFVLLIGLIFSQSQHEYPPQILILPLLPNMKKEIKSIIIIIVHPSRRLSFYVDGSLKLKVDMPILTCIFFTLNWLTLTSEMHFVKFHPEVASCLLSRGKRKYAPLGMRLIWKYIRNYLLVYQLISHFFVISPKLQRILS